MSTVIKVENISKQYRLGDVGTGAIKDDIKRWRYRMMGKEDPFLQVGAENDRTSTTKDDYVWALRDINFEVKQGEVLGIIGRNGAGKSTLLKILSRTTAPTTGSIKVKGRIASLLEVGTGFHPELTGRDNIFLNGAILGMTKAEIRSKFDEIVDFAGVEKYIDTPVKRYSSGMYVRLAFGVAAHLEPEILIVDEVLAVGDAEFQKKALGKMKDVSVNQGRTVLFVSHNMSAVKNLCSKGLLMENGKISLHNTISVVTDKYYLTQNRERKYSFSLSDNLRHERHGEILKINKIVFNDNNPVFYGEQVKVDFYFELNKNITDLNIGIGINTLEETRILTIDSDSHAMNDCLLSFPAGKHVVSVIVENFNLSPGLYSFDAAIRDGRGTLNILDLISKEFGLEVLHNRNTPNHLGDTNTGGYRPRLASIIRS